MSRIILGLDIGGANLKAATNTRETASVPFALWRQPEQLASELKKLVSCFQNVEEFAITMTGELCDCFATKADGVNHILTAVQSISRSYPIRVWSTSQRFLTVEEARQNHRQVAAANWHALATFVGSYNPRGTSLLIDIGSTTTDLIPILDGIPHSIGLTDPIRLEAEELLYSGVRRTPICAFTGLDIATELFATTLDAYLLLGLIPESAETDTADGRVATKAKAHSRMARMYCGDAEEIPPAQTEDLAQQVYRLQKKQLERALDRQSRRLRELQLESLGTSRVAILSGSGEFLVQQVLRSHQDLFTDSISLTERLGEKLAAAAPAYAVAVLAAERPLA
jgi:(4-(4-[2-(gamma-L-glutamylamino)ethyl]phenoxymethyl)furan-2-yl)methanamine synthase